MNPRASLLAAFLALAAGPAFGGHNESSFTPDSINAAVWGVSLFNSTASLEAPLYACPGPSDSSCTVNLEDQAALNALFSSSIGVPAGSYDQVFVRHCSTGTSYTAGLQGHVVLGGTTYYTSAGPDPLTTSAGSGGQTVVTYQGCSTTYHLPTPLTISAGTSTQVNLFFAAQDIAWATLGPSVIPSGCVQNSSGTDSLCMAYPDIVPSLGSSSPVLEKYYVLESSHPGGAGGELLLVADSASGGLIAGFTRRLFSETSTPLSTAFDTALQTIRDNGDGTWYLESYGSFQGDTGFVHFPHFIRTTHFGTYLDHVGTAVGYLAGRDMQVGLPGCPAGPLLTAFPVAINNSTSPPVMVDFAALVPLGNFNPGGGHVFPADHQYFYLRHTVPSDFSSPTVVSTASAPADGWVTQIETVESSVVSSTITTHQFRLDFSPCRDFSVHWDHLTGLSAPLSAIVASWYSVHPSSGPSPNCLTNNPIPTSTFTSCWIPAMLPVSAGTPLAQVGGGQVLAFDWGAHDSRVPPLAYTDPSRYLNIEGLMDQFHVVCGFDYYADPLHATIQNFFGDYQGVIKRTIPPLCGTVMQDIAGTAQGNWFNPTIPFQLGGSETPNLALAHGNVLPNLGVFSVGNSVSTLPTGTYYFTPNPDPTSMENRDFGLVTDSQVYCYDGLSSGYSGGTGGPLPNTAILIQLADASTLRIQAIVVAAGAGCASLGPPSSWTLSAYTEFDR